MFGINRRASLSFPFVPPYNFPLYNFEATVHSDSTTRIPIGAHPCMMVSQEGQSNMYSLVDPSCLYRDTQRGSRQSCGERSRD
jgi:hypothetical protein